MYVFTLSISLTHSLTQLGDAFAKVMLRGAEQDTKSNLNTAKRYPETATQPNCTAGTNCPVCCKRKKSVRKRVHVCVQVVYYGLCMSTICDLGVVFVCLYLCVFTSYVHVRGCVA